MTIRKRTVKYVLLLGLFLVLLLFGNRQVLAASPITINMVDYVNENIIVNNNGNSRIYFATESDAARNLWESMFADTGTTSSIDFSWVTSTADQAIIIKGEDGVQTRVVLKERAKKLEITISYENMSKLNKTDTIASMLNIMSTAGTGNNPITFSDLEWRKGENGSWKNTALLTVAELEKLQIKGADLYFRIKALNDTTLKDGTGGRRVSS